VKAELVNAFAQPALLGKRRELMRFGQIWQAKVMDALFRAAIPKERYLDLSLSPALKTSPPPKRRAPKRLWWRSR